jgi:uncharacterized protein YnzC (UPF0291/DUF896 family)
MGNKNCKESPLNEKEINKKEYFQAVRTDMKNTMGQINSLIHIDQDSRDFENNWAKFIKNKLEQYFQNCKNQEKIIKEISLYFDNLVETNESKHILNLGIFIKKYHDQSNRKQTNSK